MDKDKIPEISITYHMILGRSRTTQVKLSDIEDVMVSKVQDAME